MDTSSWWTILLLIFLAGGTLAIAIAGFRRLWANRRNIDLSNAMSARAGYTMGGNWVQPIDNGQIVVAEHVDDRYDPPKTHPAQGADTDGPGRDVLR